MKKEKLKLLLPDESGLNASLFVSIIAIVLGLAYYLARFGFENNSFFRIVLIVGLSLFLIFFPEALDLLRLRRKDPKYWYNLKPLNLMLGLLLLIILGAIVLGKYSGIAGLAWGTLIGAFIGNIVYTYICLRKAGFSFKL